MRLTKSFSLVALVAAGALVLSACSGDSKNPETTDNTPNQTTFPAGSTMAEIVDKGVLTVGTKFDQPYFGLKGPSGDPVGFDVEIAKLIAGALGVKAEFVESVSSNREPYIENGTVDIVVATYTISDTRKELISFAGPYYNAGQSILTLKTNNTIKSEADLAGIDVCTASGTTPEAKLNEIGAKVTSFDTYAQCLEPLRSGAVQALSTDNVILAGFEANNPGEFKLVGTPFTKEPYGIGLAKDADDFREFINDVLEKAYKDGSYEAAWNSTAGQVMPYVKPPAVDRY